MTLMLVTNGNFSGSHWDCKQRQLVAAGAVVGTDAVAVVAAALLDIYFVVVVVAAVDVFFTCFFAIVFVVGLLLQLEEFTAVVVAHALVWLLLFLLSLCHQFDSTPPTLPACNF